MIKKTGIPDKNIEKSFGKIDGLINKIIITNPNDTSTSPATIQIKTADIILYNEIISAKTTSIVKLDTILTNEDIVVLTDSDNMNVIINIIEA